MQHCSVRTMIHFINMSLISVVQVTQNLFKEALLEDMLLLPMKAHQVFRISQRLSLVSPAPCRGIFTPPDILLFKRMSN